MKFRATFVLIAISGALGCSAAGKYYDREKNDPRYYPPGPGTTAGKSVPTPAPGVGENVYLYNDKVGLAAAAVAGLAQGVIPNYYKKSSITGSCIAYADRADTLGVPCNNVVVLLTDPDGKELARVKTGADGRFGFAVASGVRYCLTVASEKWVVRSGAESTYQMSDEAVLALVPSARAAASSPHPQ